MSILTRRLSRYACALALLAVTAPACGRARLPLISRAAPAPEPERGTPYAELARLYSTAQEMVQGRTCGTAPDTLDRLIREDRAVRFPLAVRMLEECYTAQRRYDEARALYADAVARATAHDDTAVQQLAPVFKEWRERYEVFLETGERVVPRPDEFARVVDGVDGLRRALVLPDSQKAGVFHGSVRVHARIDEQGAVINAFVQESSGIRAYDDAAVAAVRAARFVPARIRGREIRTWISIPIEF